METTDLTSCGVLVVRGEPIDEFLLMKHADRWDLPKGHVDPGETDIECALRELEEETGIAPTNIELDPDFLFQLQYYVQYKRTGGQRRLKTLKVYLGRLQRDVPIVVTEHIGYQWFHWNPPHAIQQETIDPLLESVEEFMRLR